MKHLICIFFIQLLIVSTASGDTNQYLTRIDHKYCKQGLTNQPEGGPFSVFVFCDDALGSNIGVINIEPGAGPGSIKLPEPKTWIWTTDDRFWQEREWAADVTSFAWSPDKTKLYVATHQIYGSGGVFELNFLKKSVRQLAPKTERVSISNPGAGYRFTRIDIKDEKLYYKSLKKDNETEDFIDLKSPCNNDLDYWLDCNNPIAIKYLQSLGHKDIGKVVSGVELTDKTVEFQNLTYIGKSDSLGTLSHVYIFKWDNKDAPSVKYLAYIWVDEGGEPLKLPTCEEGDPVIYMYHDPHVLSWDVYIWDSVQPGDGVVSTICVPQSWLDAVGFKK